MAFAFEPSRSTTMRPSLGPSLADTLPNINFGFDDLRDRMSRFTAKFDAFIEQGRKRVLEERNQFRVSMAELEEDQRMKKKDIEILHLKTAEHQESQRRERDEAREMEAAIAGLEAQRDAQQAARDALRAQMTTSQRDIDARLAAQRAAAARRDAQARFNVPELDFWVTNLCLRIEGAGAEDRLKMVYSHVDERDWDREAWFELSTAGRDYDVRHCRPRLPRDKVDAVLKRVNETRELAALLKGMRELFVEAMKG